MENQSELAVKVTEVLFILANDKEQRNLIIKDLEKEPLSDDRTSAGVKQLVVFGNLIAHIDGENSPLADLPATLESNVCHTVTNALVEYLLDETENLDQAAQLVLDWRYPETATAQAMEVKA